MAETSSVCPSVCPSDSNLGCFWLLVHMLIVTNSTIMIQNGIMVQNDSQHYAVVTVHG